MVRRSVPRTRCVMPVSASSVEGRMPGSLRQAFSARALTSGWTAPSGYQLNNSNVRYYSGPACHEIACADSRWTLSDLSGWLSRAIIKALQAEAFEKVCLNAEAQPPGDI